MGTSLTQLGPAAQRQVIEQIGAQEAAKRAKYGNVRVEQKSTQGFVRTYDSKAEARYAAMLDHGIAAKLVLWWIPQPSFPLPGKKAYRGDFLVAWADGRVTVADVKGMDTPMSKLKRDQLKALYGIEVELVKR